MMGDWDGSMGAAGWLLMTVFWVALLGVIVWAVLAVVPSRRGSEEARERPEDVLDRRLALGEIDPATYDQLQGKLRAARAERK